MVAVHAPSLTVVAALCQTVLVVLVGIPLLAAFGIVGMAQGICATRIGIAILLVVFAHRMTCGGSRPFGTGGASCSEAAR
jgi:hypothetical protein